MAIWNIDEASDKICAKCGSTYTVEYHQVPTKDIDSFKCCVCGFELDRWKSTRCPSYALKVRSLWNLDRPILRG